jgi:hypothetical protein
LSFFTRFIRSTHEKNALKTPGSVVKQQILMRQKVLSHRFIRFAQLSKPDHEMLANEVQVLTLFLRHTEIEQRYLFDMIFYDVSSVRITKRNVSVISNEACIATLTHAIILLKKNEVSIESNCLFAMPEFDVTSLRKILLKVSAIRISGHRVFEALCQSGIFNFDRVDDPCFDFIELSANESICCNFIDYAREKSIDEHVITLLKKIRYKSISFKGMSQIGCLLSWNERLHCFIENTLKTPGLLSLNLTGVNYYEPSAEEAQCFLSQLKQSSVLQLSVSVGDDSILGFNADICHEVQKVLQQKYLRQVLNSGCGLRYLSARAIGDDARFFKGSVPENILEIIRESAQSQPSRSCFQSY